MRLTTSTKSRAILSLIKTVPGFMSKKNVKTLATDPNNNVLGFEDASEAISAIDLSAKEKKDIDDKEKNTKLDELFPNPRLTAELEIIKDIDRMKYHEFTNKMIELDSIAKEVEEAAGPSFDMLLDEIADQIQDKSILKQIKNMGVSIINVEDGKIAHK